MKNFVILFVFSMLINNVFADTNVETSLTAVDEAAVCSEWLTVYPARCPEQYFHLCLDNYEGFDQLEDEVYRQGNMRCN